MSLKTMPRVKIFNALSAGTVVVSGGNVTIHGLPTFAVADVYNCFRTCTTDCTPQVTVVTPIIPDAPCECPWSFEMTIRRNACGFERSWDVFEHNYVYNYTNPSGDAPTLALIIASVVNQINSDPNSPVTAVNTGDADTTITLTEKDCDSMARTCGFTVTGNSVTTNTTTAHVPAVLPIWEVQRSFPIVPGMNFSNPNLAFCGTEYCVYYFHIRPSGTVRDPHVSDAYVSKEMEVMIYVNADLANIIADFDAELTAALTCLGDPLV